MPRNPPTPDHRPRGAHLASEQRWTGEALGALLAASSPGLTARVSTSRTAVDYLDTQDWALLRAGQVLERIAGAVDVELQLRTHGGTPARIAPFAGRPPLRTEDLSAPFLRRSLQKLTDGRALLSLARVRRSETLVCLVDAQDKIRLRVGLREERPSGSRRRAVNRYLVLEPVTGYRRELRAAHLALRDAGWTVTGDPLHAALLPSGRQPFDYPRSLSVEMGARQPVRVVYNAIGLCLLEVMHTNLPGVRGDWDEEFLHDFRVALRRTRTLLAQLPDVLPATRVRRFTREFRWIGNLSGAARDGDVQIDEMHELASSLPAGQRSKLEPLHRWTRDRREAARARMLTALDSARYRRLIDSWGALLGEAPGSRSRLPNAGRAVGELAAERIKGMYRRLLRKGGKINDSSPAAHLHELRKDAKKLRYLIEFFRPLYREHRVALLVGDLKLLQDNLGTFQDLDVQRGLLLEFSTVAPAATVAVLDELTVSLRQREAQVRDEFEGRFAAFAADPVRAHLVAMLAESRAARDP